MMYRCADYPDLQCIYREHQMAQQQDPVPIGEHGAASVGCPTCSGAGAAAGSQQTPVNIALTVAFTNPVSMNAGHRPSTASPPPFRMPGLAPQIYGPINHTRH